MLYAAPRRPIPQRFPNILLSSPANQGAAIPQVLDFRTCGEFGTNNTGWFCTGSVLTSDAGWPAPDGTGRVNSATLTEDSAAASDHLIVRENIQPITANLTHAAGVCAKSLSTNTHQRFLKIEMSSLEFNNTIMFVNLQTGAIFFIVPGASPITATTGFTRYRGDGWWEAYYLFKSTETGVNMGIGMSDNGGNGTYDGDGVSGMSLFGPYIRQAA